MFHPGMFGRSYLYTWTEVYSESFSSQVIFYKSLTEERFFELTHTVEENSL